MFIVGTKVTKHHGYSIIICLCLIVIIFHVFQMGTNITCISILIWSSTNNLVSAYMTTHLEILRKYLSEDHDTKIPYSLYDLYTSITRTRI